jgi:hypothetical protein
VTDQWKGRIQVLILRTIDSYNRIVIAYFNLPDGKQILCDESTEESFCRLFRIIFSTQSVAYTFAINLTKHHFLATLDIIKQHNFHANNKLFIANAVSFGGFVNEADEPPEIYACVEHEGKRLEEKNCRSFEIVIAVPTFLYGYEY